MTKLKIGGYPRSGVNFLCALVEKNFKFDRDISDSVSKLGGSFCTRKQSFEIHEEIISPWDKIKTDCMKFGEDNSCFNVMIYRNPLDVMYSIFNYTRRSSVEFDGILPDEAGSEVFASWLEREYIEECASFVYKNIPGRNKSVDYAIPYELVSNRSTFSSILDVIGAKFDLEKEFDEYKFVNNLVGWSPAQARVGYSEQLQDEISYYFSEVIGSSFLCYEYKSN